MIHCYFSFDDGHFHFKLNDTFYFTQVVELLKKKYHLEYNSLHKTWMSKNAILAQAIYLDLQDYDEVTISEDDRQLIEDMIYPEDDTLKKIKLQPDKELLALHPPLIGKAPFENFQLDAIKKTLSQNRRILDIEMRHGKTFIMCMVLGTLYKLKKIDRIFIIARPEGVENFRLEVLRFLGTLFTEDDIGIVTTKNRKIDDYFDKKIIITNYTTFRLSGDYYNKQSKSTARKPTKKTIDFSKWSTGDKFLLLDETQSINSYDSLQSHFIHLYKDDFFYRVGMSGSLGYNYLAYYSQCKFLVPKMIPYCFSEWTSYIADKGTKFSPSAIKEFRPAKLKEFKEQVIDKLQITYKGCIQETENIETITYVRMNDKMKEVYRLFVEKEINNITIRKEMDITGAKLENMFMYLGLVTSDISLLDEKYSKGWKFEDNPKVEITKSLLEKYIDEEGKKVVIWGSHPKVLNQLAEVLKKYNPIVIHGSEGSVKKEERDTYVKKFKTDKKCKVLLASYVLSTSITLTEASRQIYFDVSLNSDNHHQSKKRIHGPTQKELIITNHLLFNNSIDIYIYFEILQDRLRKKTVIGSKEKLSHEDYRKVFNAKAESYLSYRPD